MLVLPGETVMCPSTQLLASWGTTELLRDAQLRTMGAALGLTTSARLTELMPNLQVHPQEAQCPGGSMSRRPGLRLDVRHASTLWRGTHEKSKV